MSHINNYCYINNKNETNECEDPNYLRIYYNKDSEVSKLNMYGPPPSMTPGPINKNKPINPGDSYNNNNKDIINNTGSPIDKNNLKILNSVTTLTNSLNYTSNSIISNNSTLQYGHVGHNSKDDTVLTEKQ
jgi:hypothetical protein